MICEICNKNKATQKHHLLSQTKLYKKIYKEYIHHSDNIINVCEECHLWKGVPKWSELQFCENFGIEPRSKSGIQKMQNIRGK
ncbi:MAG: hypothetical protein PVF17_00895 [Ignavibacteria bacterium]|jgi:hypothetical protein